MRYALALLLLSLSSLAAGVDYDDVARIDFPARDRTVFLAGCYSMHTENVLRVSTARTQSYKCRCRSP
jgi:hypothetical protein